MILLNNDELKALRSLLWDKLEKLDREIKETCDGEVKDAVKESVEKFEKLNLYIGSKIQDD